jgi:hypothetical protein
MYLNGDSLDSTKPTSSGTVSYDGPGSLIGPSKAIFKHVFDKETRLIGHSKAKLFSASASSLYRRRLMRTRAVSTELVTDMDIFVAVFKIDKQGEPVLVRASARSTSAFTP